MKLRIESHEKLAQLMYKNPNVKIDEVKKECGWSDDKHTVQMMRRSSIKERVKEIEKEEARKEILTLDQRLKLLSDLAQDKNESTPNRIKAIEALTKLTDRTKEMQVDGEGIPKDIIQPVIIQLPDNKR